jgi:hypothetical protein
MDEAFAQRITWYCDKDPASDDSIRQFVEQSGTFLPQQYVQFLKKYNGGEGFVGPNAYLMLWSIDELAEMNTAYNVNEYASNLLLFGSSGAGEAYGFDAYAQMEIVRVPFVGMSPDLMETIASTFNDFIESLAKSKPLEGAQDPESRLINKGKEIFELQPILSGGSPTDPANKVVLTREQHIEAVNSLNKFIKELKQQQKK